MNWLSKLLGFKDIVMPDVGKLLEDSRKESVELFSGMKNTKGKDISEPVLGIIKAFRQNPKRFKFIDDGHPKPDYFRFDRYAGETAGNYFAVVDKVTGEKFFCSVSGLGCLSIQDSRTFMSQFGNLCVLGFSLKKAKKLVGAVHNEWVTKDESALLVGVIGHYQQQRVIKAAEWYERKDSKEERVSKIKKALALVNERNRLKEIYK